MIEYSLVNEKDQELISFLSNDIDSAIKHSLNTLGYRVEPQMNDDTVREYFVIDNTSGEEVNNFAAFFYESACLEALTRLGYTCFANHN